MKKLLMILAVVSIAGVMLAGCSGGGDSATTPPAGKAGDAKAPEGK